MANTGRRSGQSAAERSASSPSGARDRKKSAFTTAAELDRAFDDGENVLDAFDVENARRPGLEPRRVNVDFPSWVVEALDRQADRLGVTRQALIKLWIAERLEKAA
jgi:hypothetical protein